MSYQTKCAGTAGLPYVTDTKGGITIGAFPAPPPPSGFTWHIVTSADNPVQILSENAYICEGGVQVVFILQLAPSLGDPFIIISSGATFRINQNANQSLRIGAEITTTGATGFVNSNGVGDTILVYYIGGNDFISMSPQGTLTVN